MHLKSGRDQTIAQVGHSVPDGPFLKGGVDHEAMIVFNDGSCEKLPSVKIFLQDN